MYRRRSAAYDDVRRRPERARGPESRASAAHFGAMHCGDRREGARYQGWLLGGIQKKIELNKVESLLMECVSWQYYLNVRGLERQFIY